MLADSGKLDRIAQHAAPMQPSQPAHGIGIASISVTKPGIHLPQKPAARRGRESRDQAKARWLKTRRPATATAIVPITPAMANVRK